MTKLTRRTFIKRGILATIGLFFLDAFWFEKYVIEWNYFDISKPNNNKINQITLIEIENIKYYNQAEKVLIPSIDFRRNIITEGIKLNQLLGKEFLIGSVKLKAHDLCRPCKYLQERLKQKNFIKELLQKGGIRCEVLNNGKINIGSNITNE